MDSQRIKKEAEGLEGLKAVFAGLLPDKEYEIQYVSDKNNPHSQKAVLLVQSGQPPLIGHYDLLGRPAIGPVKELSYRYLTTLGVESINMDKHFVDVSRMRLMQANSNSGFFGYGARMEPPQPCSYGDAIKRLEGYMKDVATPAVNQSIKQKA